jgi:hypothetical protein
MRQLNGLLVLGRGEGGENPERHGCHGDVDTYIRPSASKRASPPLRTTLCITCCRGKCGQ